MKKLLMIAALLSAQAAQAGTSGWVISETALPGSAQTGASPSISLVDSYSKGNDYAYDIVKSADGKSITSEKWGWGQTSVIDFSATNLVKGDQYTITESGGKQLSAPYYQSVSITTNLDGTTKTTFGAETKGTPTTTSASTTTNADGTTTTTYNAVTNVPDYIGGRSVITDLTTGSVVASAASGEIFGAGAGSVTFTATSANEKIQLKEAPEIDANLAGLSIGLLSGILFLLAERRRTTTN